jgi:hypothetical protein
LQDIGLVQFLQGLNSRPGAGSLPNNLPEGERLFVSRSELLERRLASGRV